MPRPATWGAMLALGFGTTSVSAQDFRNMVSMNCADNRVVQGFLLEKFAEVPVSHGLQADGKLLQVFASEQTGSWSMVATTPDGQSCIVAIGQAWEIRPIDPLA